MREGERQLAEYHVQKRCTLVGKGIGDDSNAIAKIDPFLFVPAESFPFNDNQFIGRVLLSISEVGGIWSGKSVVIQGVWSNSLSVLVLSVQGEKRGPSKS